MLLLCASYLDGALHFDVCACMLMNVPTVHMLSRQRFEPLVNAVTWMAFKFCCMILKNKCCLNHFVPFDQVNCGGATYTRKRLILE